MNLKSTSKLVCGYIGFLLLLCAIYVAGNKAFADADVTLSWQAPTQCSDGTNIGSETCGALTKYILYCGTTAGGPYKWVWGIDAVTLTDTRNYVDGEYYCIMRARNAAGVSADSNEVFFTVTTPPPSQSVPNPPSTITIEVRASQ